MGFFFFQLSLFTIRVAHTARMYIRRILGDTRSVHEVRVLLDRGDGYVLLVRHWYAPGVWTLPGGGIEWGEDIYVAAARELKEETGYTACDQPELLGTYTGAREDDKVAVLIISRIEGSMRLLPDIEVMERGFFDIKDLPKNISPANQRRIEEYARGDRGVEGAW